MHKAVFLDRDGVINSDEGHYYIYKLSDFKINEGLIDNLKLLVDNSYKLFIITNQGGIAKGIYTLEDVEKIHNYLLNLLKENGITIEEVYVCPHHDSIKKCECRKPSPYMINKAIEKYKIIKNESYMIGDSIRDIQAAEAAGIKGILSKKNTNIKDICINIINKNI